MKVRKEEELILAHRKMLAEAISSILKERPQCVSELSRFLIAASQNIWNYK